MKRALAASLILIFVWGFAACRDTGTERSENEPNTPRFEGVYRLTADGAEYEMSLRAQEGCVRAELLSPASMRGLTLQYDGASLTYALEGMTGAQDAESFTAQTALGSVLKAVSLPAQADRPEEMRTNEEGVVTLMSDPGGKWKLEKKGAESAG
ncbi:MAG: hypothetical protein IJK23_02250 [Clostridia bacterium]|nr:hypothetical protein [Clostridia bacterium]